MYTPWALVVAGLVAVMPGVLAASSSSTGLDVLPNCALTCLAAAVANSDCSVTDQTCMCTSKTLQNEVTVCVTKSCTVKEALFTKNVTMTNCHAPIRDKSSQYVILSDAFGIISGVFILQRFVYKIYAKLEIGLDDWFILTTIISGIPSSVINVHGLAANGLGKDIWTVDFESITRFGQFFYVMAILYFLQVTLLKLSLLFFYLRIFPSNPTRTILWATVVFNVVFGAVFVAVSIFQCKPISYFWTKWDGEHEGTCVDVGAIGWSNAAISIALDIWMLVVPMSQLRKLNLDWRKKIGVGLMFIVGTFVTIVSVLRLRSLIQFGHHSQNPTWEYLQVSKWSTVEINVGIICACMPSIRMILVRLFPKILGTSRRYLSNYASNRDKSKQQSSRRMSKPLGNSVSSHVDRSRHDRAEAKGITLHTTYAVEYGDNDEMGLVQMRDLDYKSSRASRSDASV